jgi:hypothetical protein
MTKDKGCNRGCDVPSVLGCQPKWGKTRHVEEQVSYSSGSKRGQQGRQQQPPHQEQHHHEQQQQQQQQRQAWRDTRAMALAMKKHCRDTADNFNTQAAVTLIHMITATSEAAVRADMMAATSEAAVRAATSPAPACSGSRSHSGFRSTSRSRSPVPLRSRFSFLDNDMLSMILSPFSSPSSPCKECDLEDEPEP